MFTDFAPTYDDTVLDEYKYEAYFRVPRAILALLRPQQQQQQQQDDAKSPPLYRRRRVLDLGCGTGLSAQEFFRQGTVNEHEVVGLDLTQAMLDACAKNNMNHYVRLVCGSVEDGALFEQEFESASFDIVLALGVFEFVNSFQGVLDNAHRVLRAGGYFGLTIPIKNESAEESLSIHTYVVDDVLAQYALNDDNDDSSPRWALVHREEFTGYEADDDESIVMYTGIVLKKL